MEERMNYSWKFGARLYERYLALKKKIVSKKCCIQSEEKISVAVYIYRKAKQ